ncbi:MAG: beta-ketoacyl-[acyl-carrier-protein] synthase II [Gammaproteobacteria bacterium HGW-Gammaproteobacteria-10]|nr:MAG: beta-ketoacyl-[acyl-carrier-protein] synthase II [Gammaproteobacteria bacterium HGW-Gammaproteobacteria-10]
MTLYLNDLGILSAVGGNGAEMLSRLLAGDRSGLIKTDEYSPGKPFYVGEIRADLPEIERKYSDYDCKNNRLLLAALSQIQDGVDRIKRKYRADRIGVVIGTSTSGVRNTELAIAAVAGGLEKPSGFHYKQQQLAGGADFLAHLLGLKGPAYSVSTACSSSGRAFASARRLIELDVCDAVIVGGADSLCRFTVNGFAALESVSAGLCKPFGKHRDGINLSEAAALFILSRDEGTVRLGGIGASSDAYHFSAPDPGGVAVVKAMQSALNEAGMAAEQIDYINLHGTATPLNDAMESAAVAEVFGRSVSASSTKGMAGHALGAAGALELGLCWLLLNSDDDEGALPPNVNDDALDDSLPPLNLVRTGQVLGRRIEHCQSNSFAFGGNNISIVVSRV